MASSVRRFGKQSIRNWSKRSTSSILALPTTSSSSSTTAFTTAASFKTASASASSTASSYSPSLSHSALLDFISHSTSKVVVRVDDPKSGGGGDEGNHDDNPEDPEDQNKDDQQQFTIKIISYLLALIGGAAGVAMVLPVVREVVTDFDKLMDLTINVWGSACVFYVFVNCALLFRKVSWPDVFGNLAGFTILIWGLYLVQRAKQWYKKKSEKSSN